MHDQMKPRIDLHRIARLEVTRIQHFPAGGDRPKPFWQRDLIVYGDGGQFKIGLYSDTADGLLTCDERKEDADRAGEYADHLARERAEDPSFVPDVAEAVVNPEELADVL